MLPAAPYLCLRLSFLAWLIYPSLFVKTIELDPDDIASWAGKGPGAQEPGFPQHLAAAYFLDGNVLPDFKLSALCVMDLSYCKYDAATRTMSFDSQSKFQFVVGTDCSFERLERASGLSQDITLNASITGRFNST